MSNPEDWKVQLSLSTPPAVQYHKGHMLNLRGNTVEEVQALIDAVLENDGDFLLKAVEVGSVLLVAQGFNTPEAPAASSTTEAAGDSAPVANLHVCKHGKRVERSGTGKRGPWTGYFCPQPKGSPDQCDAQWAD